MTFKLRPYQQAAVDATTSFISKCHDSCLLELATGAGKSLIVAEVAKWVKEKSNKKVLCLAPSKELVMQNREKYLAYGEPASIFSASAGKKELQHCVVFGSPLSVLNSIESFGAQFSAVVIDEAHEITPTIKKIIDHIKTHNPMLRVIGLTATPYRMKTGYIYRLDQNGDAVPEEQTCDPYFAKLLYQVKTQELIDQDFLTQPIADHCDGYNTENLELKSNGKFSQATIEQAFEGHGRKTADIVAQVVAISSEKKGVMFFAATIQHAKEIIASLPSDNSELVTGTTKKAEREAIISNFKKQSFKYLVNVSVLTTGFDAPHVDVVAVLRATESAALFQQIIGRGLRLSPGKKECLILDFAENIERHELEDDLFNPKISATFSSGEKVNLDAKCETCSTVNTFSARPNPDNFGVDEYGYFLDLLGNRIKTEAEEPQEMPAHFGRRCTAETIVNGVYERCSGRWSFKACANCDHENDIAARYCSKCKSELVDPNEKLKIEFKRMKRNPHEQSSDKVISWFAQEWHSKAGNKTLRVDYTTEYRIFSVWYSPESKSIFGQHQWNDLCLAVFGRIAPSIELFVLALNKGAGEMPMTVTSKKQGDFFRVSRHNQEEDVQP